MPQRYTKKANGRSYIVQSAVGLPVYVVLSTIASLRILSAEQLSFLVKIAICGFLWVALVWMAVVLRGYYRKLPDE